MVPLARTAAAVRARPSCQSCSVLFFPAHPYIALTYRIGTLNCLNGSVADPDPNQVWSAGSGSVQGQGGQK